MVFSQLTFLFFFLPLTLAAYFLLPAGYKSVALFAFSIVFYAWGEPIYVLLMLVSIAVNFLMGLLAKPGSSARRPAIVAAVIFDLLMLGVFKYSGLFANTITELLGIYVPDPGLSLPIGISFYTFQAMSYVVDVYRGDVKATGRVIDFGAYLTMFPQLIAGPIVRYKTIEEELKAPDITIEGFSCGISRFIVGLSKKVLIANSVGRVWSVISESQAESLSTATSWVGLLAFTLQIYFDFSGYSDMAIGMGRMLGFHFPENFDHPYESGSITEFWRRWHVTLGSWFREYVYYPLGGSRYGKARQLFNIFLVWMLTGLWHGASWNFLVWGIYYALILFIEKLGLLGLLQKMPKVLSGFYTMVFVVIGWGIFSWGDMADAPGYFMTLAGLSKVPMVDGSFFYFLRSYGILFVLGIFASTSLAGRLWERVLRYRAAYAVEALLLVLSVCFLVFDTYNPFLYFRF